MRLGLPNDAASVIPKRIESMRASGSAWLLPLFQIFLAESHLRDRRSQDSVSASESALSEIERRGDRIWLCPALWTKGDALLANDRPDVDRAQQCFVEAIDNARSQSAKLWELRAATRLARLWHSQDKTTEASDLLTPIYDWFTEGFDTADLKEAKALLDELS